MSPLKTTLVRIMKNSGEVAESYLSSQHYYPPITFRLLKVNENGDINIFNASEEVATEQLDNLTSIIDFMNANVSSGSSSKNTIKDIPEALRKMVTEIRETPRMRFEYKKSEFYSALRRVGDKAAKVEDVDESGYEIGGGVVLATTGWVRVEKDGKAFELKFDTVDQMNNGSYADLDEVSRREVGDEGEGQYLFGETQLWPITFRPIRTVEQLQECIDMLELLDKAIPDPEAFSS